MSSNLLLTRDRSEGVAAHTGQRGLGGSSGEGSPFALGGLDVLAACATHGESAIGRVRATVWDEWV
jgi:hypothetical protein